MNAVTRIGVGTYSVKVDGGHETVYVAGSSGDLWAFWLGRVFRIDEGDGLAHAHGAVRLDDSQSLTAPMPATVVKVLVKPGATVRRGDTLVVLEAMKMELPIRATGDGTVRAVHCREGELVQSDSVLVQLA